MTLKVYSSDKHPITELQILSHLPPTSWSYRLHWGNLAICSLNSCSHCESVLKEFFLMILLDLPLSSFIKILTQISKKKYLWFKLCLCTGKSFTCFENGGDSADLILDRNDLIRWRCGRLKSSWTWKGFPEQMKNIFFMKYSWISNCVWQFRCFCLFVDSQNGNKMIW